MKKEDYFRRSKAEGLPNRCPILEHCVRRMFTMYFYGNYQEPDPEIALKGYLPMDFKQKAIGYFGEAPVWHAPPDRMSGYFHGMCPEVNLFDHEHQLWGMAGTASSDGSWDNEGANKDQRLEFKHYSECAEFSKHVFDSRQTVNKPTRKRRAGVSRMLRFEVFQRDKFTCHYCNRTKEDGIKLQLDHRLAVSQGGTDDFSNLVTSCEDCNQGKSNKIVAPLG
jgi:HNH endonuclease